MKEKDNFSWYDLDLALAGTLDKYTIEQLREINLAPIELVVVDDNGVVQEFDFDG